MKKPVVLTLVSVALGACATPPPKMMTADPNHPKVYVVTLPGQQGRYLVVDQDRIHFSKGQVQTIVWHLEDTSGQFSFPRDGIGPFLPLPLSGGLQSPPADTQIDMKKCVAAAKTFVCTYNNNQTGWYKYTIRVTASDANDPQALDPTVGND